MRGISFPLPEELEPTFMSLIWLDKNESERSVSQPYRDAE